MLEWAMNDANEYDFFLLRAKNNNFFIENRKILKNILFFQICCLYLQP